MFFWIAVFLPIFCFSLEEKVLILGVCRNIEKTAPNTIQSIETLGKRFADYRAILYENNSNDQTKTLLQAWAKKNPKVIFITEKLSSRKLRQALSMKVINRTEQIARARNIALSMAMKKKFDDYTYIIWADLDFETPWNVDAIVETIEKPEQEFDAVFSNGAYDLFALRSEEFPIGFELLGPLYWKRVDEVRSAFTLDEKGPWKRVYSAFGGIGIYRREALRGSFYSGVVTQDLEKATLKWLEVARSTKKGLFLQEYEALLKAHTPLQLARGSLVKDREKYPEELGVQLGQIVWFSCTPNTTLPWTCEHVPLHASMSVRGFDRLFINPRITCRIP